MRVYIASRLENIEFVRQVISRLEEVGVGVTYDWTKHGSVQDEGLSRINDVAHFEAWGVRNADACIVLLPGGRGTHVELGIAIGRFVPVLIIAPVEGHLGSDGRTCAFYHSDDVVLVESDYYDDIDWVVEEIRDFLIGVSIVNNAE